MELILRLADPAAPPGDSPTEVRLVVRRATSGEGYEIEIGGRLLAVEAPPVGPSGLRSLLVEGRQREVVVRRERAPEGSYLVVRDGLASRLAVADPLTLLARQAGGAGGARGGQRIHAYMPGRVVSVLVGVGDAVVAGQSLVVLEAMKMQNEIVAERDGTVRTLGVAPGQAVEGGDLLFEID